MKSGLVGSGNAELTALRVLNRSLWRNNVMAALEDAAGNVSAAARAMHVSRQTLLNWIHEDPALASFVKGTRDEETRRRRRQARRRRS